MILPAFSFRLLASFRSSPNSARQAPVHIMRYRECPKAHRGEGTCRRLKTGPGSLRCFREDAGKAYPWVTERPREGRGWLTVTQGVGASQESPAWVGPLRMKSWAFNANGHLSSRSRVQMWIGHGSYCLKGSPLT